MKTTALLALLLLAACSSGTSSIPDAGSPPADSGAIAAEDAGPPDLGVLAPDAAVEDAGLSPPRRQLVDLRLFGQMPLDNAVLNPQFDPGAQSWYAIGDLSGGGALLRTQFRELALSPVGLPALLLPTRATDPTYRTGIPSGTPSSVVAVGRRCLWSQACIRGRHGACMTKMELMRQQSRISVVAREVWPANAGAAAALPQRRSHAFEGH